MKIETKIETRTVEPGNRKDIGDFIALPFDIYRDSPFHVPHFRKEIRNIIKRRHSFFQHSDGEFFLALRQGIPAGRIAVLEPKRFNDYRGKRDARFYFFESIHDQDVADTLFRCAEEWALSRGLDRLIGPQGFSAFTGAGILVDGFDQRASMTMMNYHHPWYRELVEKAGFVKYKDFYSAELDAAHFRMNPKIIRVGELALKRGGYTAEPISGKSGLRETGLAIGRMYNQSWEDHEEFVPLTERELEEMIDDLSMVSDPSLIKIIKKGKDLAGFSLIFPDLSKALMRARGRLNPFTLADLLLEKRRTRHFLVNGIGVLPQYRNQGGLAVLFSEIEKTLRAHGVEKAEMTQIAETTDLMMSSIEKLGGRIYKIHRVYEKQLTPT
jgi:GNAT superfamily N-acetyltransferase